MRVRSLSSKRSFEVSLVVKQYVFILFHSFLQLKVALTITYTLSDKKLIDSYKAKMTCVIRTNWRTIIEGTVKDFWRHAMITVCFKAFVNSLTSFVRFFEEKKKKRKGKRKERGMIEIIVTYKSLWYGQRLSWINTTEFPLPHQRLSYWQFVVLLWNNVCSPCLKGTRLLFFRYA